MQIDKAAAYEKYAAERDKDHNERRKAQKDRVMFRYRELENKEKLIKKEMEIIESLKKEAKGGKKKSK